MAHPVFDRPEAAQLPGRAAPRGSRLVPEGASGYTVSNSGKTYTFTIRPGFRFSDGRPVTAANYALRDQPGARTRTCSRRRSSSSPTRTATNIVGAQAVRDGKAAKATGVRVSGNKLTINLTKADATFLAKISMPFFQAMSTKLPRGNKVINVAGNDLPSAGPYYVSTREPNRSSRCGGTRTTRARAARNLDTDQHRDAVNLEASYREVLANQADYPDGIPPTGSAELGRRFGVNKTPVLRHAVELRQLHRDEQRPARSSATTRSCARRSTTPSTARRWSASAGAMPVSRTTRSCRRASRATGTRTSTRTGRT